MGEVIIVDFAARRKSTATGERARFLELCEQELDSYDYEDLLEAINDPEFYRTVDEDIQDLVDGYWAQRA